jgi:hypothetical protein
VVKLFLADLIKEQGIVELSNMLVAMIVVCGKLNNLLNQGLSKILNWSFGLFEKWERKKLMAEFWKEVTESLEEGDITKDILMQLGMLVLSRAYDAGVGGGEEAVEE